MEAAMRSEEEMMHLILQVAKDDERVRAVYLNGSRTNPNAPKDCFQDYDVVYVCLLYTSYKLHQDFLKACSWKYERAKHQFRRIA